MLVVLRRPVALGIAASIAIAIGSYGAGATRYRGGLMEQAGLKFLTFGHGRALMEVLLTLGVVALVIAWLLLGRVCRTGAQMRHATWLWAGPLALSAPIMSRDVYSYLVQGAMHRDGVDPYVYGPAANPGNYLWEVSHDWRNTTTPYGPLHLWLGKAVTSITGENITAGVIAFRLLAVAGFVLIVWSLPRIAVCLGSNPAFALWLGAANPVVLLHLIGGMHNEALMVGLVSLGLVVLLSSRGSTFPTGSRGSEAIAITAAVALIALAVSLKATAAIVLPFTVWMILDRLRRCNSTDGTGSTASTVRLTGLFLVAGAWALGVTVAVIHLVTVASGSNWGWVRAVSGNTKVVNPLAVPTLAAELVTPFIQLVEPAFSFNTALAATRTVFSLVMLAGLIASWWVFRPVVNAALVANDRRALSGATTAYAVAFTANTVTLPWYYVSLLTLAGVVNAPRWLNKLLVGASTVIALAFLGGGNHRLYDPWFLLAAPIIGFLAATKTPLLEPAGSLREPRDHGAHQSGALAATHQG